MDSATANMDIRSISIERGQYITVWANTGTRIERQAVQLEIRITPDGRLELFGDRPIVVADFNSWYLISEGDKVPELPPRGWKAKVRDVMARGKERP